MSNLRFGMYVLQDAPLDALRRRWKEAEELGFDQLWLADHTQDFRRAGGDWFDAWAILALMAVETSKVRIGTLVSNPLLRPPAVLARAAATIDHFAGGRLELGIGTGIAGFDHEATGTPYWSIGERLARFREYVSIVDELLRTAPGRVDYDGKYLASHGVGISPPTPQRPRPPITLGGQSPTVLRMAAERGDCWNTHGPFGATFDEIVTHTRKQSAQLDDLCAAQDRDPATVRRAVLMFGPLEAWRAPDAFERTVEAFARIGFTEFVAFWPETHERDHFERALKVVDSLRR